MTPGWIGFVCGVWVGAFGLAVALVRRGWRP